MDLPDDVLDSLFVAGADALAFNAPLSPERAERFASTLTELPLGSVVDFGCGRGELARVVATHLVGSSVVGVDNDQVTIDRAVELTEAAGLSDRVRFEVADAAAWTGPVDAAICVGASHAFGSPTAMLDRIGTLMPSGVAVIGDGVWQTDPTPWCLETFGEQPSGLAGLTSIAEETGWSVVDASLSTFEEWDAFEHGWIAGVRAVGTPEAARFADLRADDYTKYRGVLGFGWLLLTR